MIRNSDWEDYRQMLEKSIVRAKQSLTNFKVYIGTIGDKPDKKAVDSAFNKVDIAFNKLDKIQIRLTEMKCILDSMDDIANKEDNDNEK